MQMPSTSKIRLVLMIDTLLTGVAGTERQLLKLIEGLNRDAFEVQLVCLRPHPWLERNAGVVRCPVTVFDIRGPRWPRTYVSFARLVGFLRRVRPQIVHTYFPVANILGVLAAHLARVPAIVSSRRDYGEWMTGPYLTATRLADRLVTRILANGMQVKDLVVRAERMPPEKIDVIYNGIDLAGYRELSADMTLKARIGIPAAHKVVGIVANFRPMKRHLTLVRAAGVILRARTDVDFVLIGTTATDGAGARLRTEAEDLTRALGIEPRVHFVGEQSDVRPYLSIMDIGVNCSEGEGLSNAVMEYMAAGIACVVSDSGGNPDLVQDGHTGRLFALGDHEMLAETVLELLSNDAVRERYRAAAYRRLEREMSTEAMLRRYQEFYCSLLPGGGRQPAADAAR